MVSDPAGDKNWYRPGGRRSALFGNARNGKLEPVLRDVRANEVKKMRYENRKALCHRDHIPDPMPH